MDNFDLDALFEECQENPGKGWRVIAGKRETFINTIKKVNKDLQNSTDLSEAKKYSAQIKQLITKANRCAEMLNQMNKEYGLNLNEYVISNDISELYASLKDDGGGKPMAIRVDRVVNHNGSGYKLYNKTNINDFAKDIIEASQVEDVHLYDEENHGLGQVVQAMITGNWNKVEPEFKNQMSTSPDSSGGYLVPEILTTNVIKKALNKTRVLQAGANVIQMDSKTVVAPKIVSMPAGAWKAENADANFEDFTFGAVTLTAKSLFVLTRMSIELAEDGRNVPQVIEECLADALALKMDYAALLADGSANDPTGVLYQPDILTIEHNAPLDDYSVFSIAYQKIEEENGTPSGLIMAPRTFGELDRMVDINGQPLKPPASWEKFAKYSTNQVPINLGTGQNETLGFLADWSKMLWGVRTGVRIEVSREAGDAFQKGQVWIRAYFRGDVTLAQPKHFLVIKGIQPVPTI